MPEAKSSKEDFLSGTFQEIIEDAKIKDASKSDRIIFTSGKVYYDLIKYSSANKINNVPILRVEQYYPYKSKRVKELLAKYSNAKKIAWVQEEPKNMGAWNFISVKMHDDLLDGQKLYYVGRPESASPAMGSSRQSVKQQKDLVEEAFNI